MEGNLRKYNAEKKQWEVHRRLRGSMRDLACQNQCETGCVGLCVSREKTEIHIYKYPETTIDSRGATNERGRKNIIHDGDGIV